MQLVGALFVVGWNVFMTAFIFALIKYILRIPLRYDDAKLMDGDDSIHGEAGYALVRPRRRRRSTPPNPNPPDEPLAIGAPSEQIRKDRRSRTVAGTQIPSQVLNV